MKLRAIFCFEVYYQLRRPSTWIYFAVILAMLFLVMDEVAEYARTVEEILLNSPATIAEISGYASKFALLLIAALAGDGAMRDIQTRMSPLVFSAPISRLSFLGGRFLGTFFLAATLVILSLPISLLIARHTTDPALFGPFSLSAHLHSTLFLTLPNIFIATALSYSIVLFTGRAMAAYLVGILMFVLSTFNLEMLAGKREWAEWIDPFGGNIISAWSNSLPPLQLSSAFLELEGNLLANRVLWAGISLLAGLLTFTCFQFRSSQEKSRKKNEQNQKAGAAATESVFPTPIPAFIPTFDTGTRLYQVRSLAWRFYGEMLTSRTAWAIPALALYAFILIPNLAQGPLSVPGLPTTARVTSIMNNAALELFVVMFISLVAGQLVWRERDARIHEISDAAPVPTWVMLSSKLAVMMLLLLTLLAVLMGAGIALQMAAGYHLPDVGLYMQELFVFSLTDYLLLAAFALVAHVLINQKYVGHMLVIIFYLYTLIPAKLGIEHKLLVFGSDPGLASSVFYSQTPFLLPWLLFKLYWTGWALLLLFVANRMWVRGKETPFIKRGRKAFKGLPYAQVLAASLILITSTGALIFYNTNILNDYITQEERIEQQVAYERQYRKYYGIPQPQISDTKLHIEFYPKQRKAVIQGIYQLINSSEKPIDSIHLAPAGEVDIYNIGFSRKARAVLTDKASGHLIYSLEQPLQPGDSLRLSYEVKFDPQGFSNHGISTAVINNGSYFKNFEWLPAIGYQAGRELSNNRLRSAYGLPPRLTESPHNAEALLNPSGQEHISFEATIGTEANQTAIAPGTLQGKWMEEGRQYFKYVTDKPIRNIYYIHSAEYDVREISWGDVGIRLFHHPEHVLNLDSFEKGIRASLDYFSKNFSPYQYARLKLVEYPDPGTGGVALPGIIGYSTNFALLHTERDSRGFDLSFAVMGHEIAHQWWGHQLYPADVAGAPLLTESLAWYSALGVVEETYGPEHLQSLLDAMRLAYLNPRSRAAVPLLYAVDQFEAYRKGPFAMYALREYIGEEKVNLALRNFLNHFKPEEPPFATSLDLYTELQAVTPDSLQYLLHDLFKTNTFWELQTKEATYQPASDDKWLVTLDVHAKKVQVDTAGVETAIPMNDLIEIGVYGKAPEGNQKTLYLKKHRIHSGANRIVVKVSEKPERAGIDPRNLLIDTEIYNNLRQLQDRPK